MRTYLRVVAAGVGIVVVGAGPAVAARTSWAPSSSPMIVKNSSGSWLGKAYGTWGINSAVTDSYGTAYIWDSRPGGHGIKVVMRSQFNAGFCYSPEYTSCTASWFGSSKVDTQRWHDASWSPRRNLFQKLSSSGDYARAQFQVCQDEGTLNPDTCTSFTYRAKPVKY